jgi:hypothetical protein
MPVAELVRDDNADRRRRPPTVFAPTAALKFARDIKREGARACTLQRR